jgi:hypothetical protein
MTQAPAPGFKTNHDYRITFEPSRRRVRVKFNGECVADSTDARLPFETLFSAARWRGRERRSLGLTSLWVLLPPRGLSIAR